ncbi:sugar transferase [Ramlibacter rhizophilus]|uniref:Sugar transferase n=2 Tax=Ramlibacter rhizophilus TaxID=1781167 RepID=A0A4Z0C0B8_9BURK|nr:sugar transferase [Ramlibacter rhizophilus]
MYRDKSDPLPFAASVITPAEVVHTRPGRELRPRHRAVKRAFDIAGALVFFTLFMPVYLAVATGVAFTSRGPVFYTQRRVGLHGRSFRFYKFRSMRADADRALVRYLDTHPEASEQWHKFQKLDDDPRITRFGAFIRRTSLDELPQFWNVLVGDMSLVGPRPCMQSQRQLYGPYWPDYCALKPGLTGLWQVSGRNRLSFSERVALDTRYAREWSIWMDLRILVKTLRVVATGDGSK